MTGNPPIYQAKSVGSQCCLTNNHLAWDVSMASAVIWLLGCGFLCDGMRQIKRWLG